MRKFSRALVLPVAFAALSACGSPAASPDAGPTADAGLVVDDYCPGSAHCPGVGDGKLYVGVAKQLINPTLVETEWDDKNADGYWQEGEEPFTDTNGNGKFDATWIAGYGEGRPATGFHDDLEVRAIALRHNDTTVVVVYLDVVGYFIDEMDRVRANPAVAALDVDHIIIGSTHDHEGVDTVGIWGKTPLDSGLNADYQELTRQRTAQAIVDAVADLRPAKMLVAQVQTVDPTGSTLDYVSDTRDPIIYDPTVTIARFVEESDPTATIGTIVNWSAHPEYSGSHNTQLTADYPHYLRDTMENGIPSESLPGIGGITVFVQGPLGGQIGPGAAHPIGPDGQPIPEHSLAKAQACGTNVGRLALQAIEDHAEEAGDTTISYRTTELTGRVDNTGYRAFMILGIFDRQIYGYNPDEPIDDDNAPWLRMRTTYLQVGPLATITAPGELHPELWVGGYDGSWSWGNEMLPEPINRPNLGLAPQPPYLRDLVLMNPGVKYAFVSGLAEDFIGYIVANFNYVLDPANPYISEAEGEHYEETNSIGPLVESQVQHPMMELARWRPPAK